MRPVSMPPEGLPRILRTARQPHPQHVHRCTEIEDIETGPLAQRGMASVGGDDQIRLDPDLSAGSRRQQSGHDPALDRKIAGFGLHLQLESRKSLGMLGEKVEEIPLRHQGDETAMGR